MPTMSSRPRRPVALLLAALTALAACNTLLATR